MNFKKRDGLMAAFLSVITCGIYRLYFWYCIGEDVNILCEDDGEHTKNFIVAWLLGIITCGVYIKWWEYRLARRLYNARGKYGQELDSPIVFCLFLTLPWLSYFHVCDVMNNYTEAYNRHGRSGRRSAAASRVSSEADFDSYEEAPAESPKMTAPKAPAKPKCPICGTPIKSGDKFCMDCGNKLG